MKQVKWMAVVLGVSLALVATVFSAYATAPELGRAAASANAGMAPALAGCTKMTASEVAWVTLDDDGEIADQVDSYESGATTITPLFEYNCVPKKTTISSVFYLNGEAVFSDKESVKASNAKGTYAYPIGTTDGSPMDDGEWGVEFYNGKTLLTSGTVVIGAGGGGGGDGGETGGDTVTVQGKVTDKKTKKPINKAVVLVLNPGVSVQDFVDGGQKDKDVFTAGQTDSKGQFTLEDPLEVGGEGYSIIIVAKGYKPAATDNFVITEDMGDPVQLDVALTK